MQTLKLTSKREELLGPLLIWRILATEELGEVSEYAGSDRNLQKLIKRSEDDGLIKSFLHSFSGRKFFYLTRNAFKEMSEETYNVNEEIYMHDAIVSAVLYRFDKYNFITDTSINYQDIKFNESIFSHGIDPDATFRASLDDQIHNIALEIELNRKSSTKIKEKYTHYLYNTQFDLVIYFFRSLKTLDIYVRYYNEFCEQKQIGIRERAIMFCQSDKLANSTLDLMKAYWLRPDGVDSKLSELFGFSLSHGHPIDMPWTGDSHVH